METLQREWSGDEERGQGVPIVRNDRNGMALGNKG